MDSLHARSSHDVILLVRLKNVLPDLVRFLISHLMSLDGHASQSSQGLRLKSSINVHIVYIKFGKCLFKHGQPPGTVDGLAG